MSVYTSSMSVWILSGLGGGVPRGGRGRGESWPSFLSGDLSSLRTPNYSYYCSCEGVGTLYGFCGMRHIPD